MEKRDLRDTVIVMASLALATLTGFLRQAVIAYTLGAGRETDIYLVAFAVPEFIFIALPIVLSPVLIPLFAQTRLEAGERPAWGWGGRVSALVMLILLGITLLAALSAPLILRWLSPGFTSAERVASVSVFYPMLPGILFMGLSTLAGSFLQNYRKFARPALTTAVYNLVFILGLVFLPLDNPLERTGWSVSLGAAAAFFFQLPLLLRVWSQVGLNTIENPVRKIGIGEALRLLGWMAAGYAAHHLILFIDRAMATAQGEGAAAVLNFGYHLALVVGQVSGLAVSTVLFPALAESVNSGRIKEASRSLNRALGMVLAVALPAGMGLVVLRVPLVQFLLEHGAFSAQATAEVSLTLAIYALAVTIDALCQPLWRFVYAWRTGWTVLVVNGVQTLVRLAANLLLVRFFGYNGLAWSAVIGLTVQLLLLGWLARRRMDWALDGKTFRQMGGLLLAGLAAGLTVGIAGWAAIRWFPELPVLIQILGGGFILLVIYGLLAAPLLKQVFLFRSAPLERDNP